MNASAVFGNAHAVLRVEGLGVRYGSLVALDDIAWCVHAGELLGIIGPNGAGKSSCFDAISAMTERQGRVFLDNRDVTAVPAFGLAQLGLKRAFQQNQFFGNLTVLENMVAILGPRANAGLLTSLYAPKEASRRKKEAEKFAAAQLIRLGVAADYHNLRPNSIPYGVQRMLSIALALGGGARVLLLDEPAAGLGGQDMDQLILLLMSLKRDGIALVVIEHHMDLIMSVADRICVLNFGRQIAIGTRNEIQSDPYVLEAYLGQSQ